MAINAQNITYKLNFTSGRDTYIPVLVLVYMSLFLQATYIIKLHGAPDQYLEENFALMLNDFNQTPINKTTFKDKSVKFCVRSQSICNN